MLSNLPEEEMLKIAESMTPAEVGEGEAPFQPPPKLPSSGEETEGGHTQESLIGPNPWGRSLTRGPGFIPAFSVKVFLAELPNDCIQPRYRGAQ